MTQITPVDAVFVPPSGAGSGATSPAGASSQPAVQSSDQPAVIVSLSGAASASQPPLPTANPNEVDKALASLGAANGLAWLNEHFDWDAYAKQAGVEKASEAKEKAFEQAGVAVSQAISNLASNPAIPVQKTVNQDATENGGAPISFAVSGFSFASNGSVYSITQAKNGLLVGTKDGQWWASWQVSNPISSPSGSDAGASAALDTLKSITAGQNLTSAAKTPDRINVTA